MRMLVLGAGLQGSACAFDLLQNPEVKEVRLADLHTGHLAPFLGAVGVAHRHAHDRDRCVDAAEWCDARNAAAGADDDAAVHLAAQDGVRAADVAGDFGRDGGRLDAEPRGSQGGGRVVDHLVARVAPALQREVEVLKLEVQVEDAGVEEPERLVQELFAGLVAVEHDDRLPHPPQDTG